MSAVFTLVDICALAGRKSNGEDRPEIRGVVEFDILGLFSKQLSATEPRCGNVSHKTYFSTKLSFDVKGHIEDGARIVTPHQI